MCTVRRGEDGGAAGRRRRERRTRARSPAPSPVGCGVSYHPQLCAPHPRRCCAPVILAEKTCVEPVLARVVQVLVEIDQFVLHTCACMRAGAGERVATWVHFGAQYAPRPRASSSVSSVAAGSDSVGAGTLALLRTWGATVRGTYPTPEAGTCTQYVQYAGPLGQAALRLRYVPNAGGWYA